MFLAVAVGAARRALDDRARVELFRVLGMRVAILGSAALALLIASGTYMTVRRLGSLDDLFDLAWGRTLLVKLGVVLAVIGLTVIHSVVQSPSLRRLKERALTAPADVELAALVRRKEARSGVVAGLILALVLVILMLAAKLAS